MNGRKLTDETMEQVTGGASALNPAESKVPCCALCNQPVNYLGQVRVEGGNTGSYKCANPGCKNCKEGTILYNNQIKWVSAAK